MSIAESSPFALASRAVFSPSVIGLLFGPAVGVVPSVPISIVTSSGREMAIELDVPLGAVVDRATMRVAAQAPNSTPIGDVATVRAAAGEPTSSSTSMIVDFGGLRNVSGLTGPAVIRQVLPWLGTSFGTDGTVPSPSDAVSMQELLTERLLVVFATPVSPGDLAKGNVTTTTPPADLELLVAGTRAWFRQGPVPAGFAEQVDITAAVQDAVAAGVSPVPVVLTARVPGHLELAPVGKVNFLRTHGVQFAQGDTTVIDTAEEGEVDVLLPLPAVSRSWVIHRVVSTVTAEDRGPQRVLPAVGPDELLEAELTLDADRPIVACLPAAALAPFATLTAARVRLAAGPGGIGVVGGLLGGNPARPGEPVPGGEVPEVTVAPSGTPEWVTLPFAKPVALPAEGTLWLSLAATRGRAVLGLRAVPPPQPATLTDDERGIAVIRRVAPNGVVKAMSAPVGLRTDGLALRLAGTAPDGAPIDLLSVALAGVRPLRRAGRAATKPEIVEVPSTAEPGDGPDRFVRALPVPAPVERLTLRATAFAATRLTVGPVVVAYEESPVPRVTEGAER